MTKILASDILIADVITKIEGNSKLAALVAKHGLKPGGKAALDREAFEEFSEAIEGHPITIVPGGSSANVLTTLNKLMGKKHQIDFLGVGGDGMYSNMIRHSLEEAGVNLIPEHLPQGGPTPQTATSFVLLYPDGQRTIATYPGNARDILKPDLINEDMVKNTDVVFVQGSLWQKLDHEFADKLMNLRWKHDKELWLALPTHAEFGTQKAGLFQWLVPTANLVLGNDEELMRIYGTTDLNGALHRLQEEFQKDEINKQGKSQRKKQVAFITRGSDGAAIVTRDNIEYVPTLDINTHEIVNTLGAGDTAFAGFAAGHLEQKLSPNFCAGIATHLAVEKLKVNGPRLPDPKKALEASAASISRELFDDGQHYHHGAAKLAR